MAPTRTWHDLIALVSLAALLLLACPLCGSLLQDQTVSLRATPTVLPARVFMLPFRQVFAVGASQPITPTQILLYESGSDVFQMIGVQDELVRLQTLDGGLNFWTARANISLDPPVAAQYDSSVRGKSARVNAAGLACLRDNSGGSPFSACARETGFVNATLAARVTADPFVFYLVEVDGQSYFLPSDAITIQ